MPPIGIRLAALLVCAGIAAAEPPKPEADPAAATVNGATIRVAQLDAVLRAKFNFLLLTEEQRQQMRKEVLPALIDELLLKQFLAKNAPPVDAAEIDKQLRAFTHALERQGKTLAEFLKQSQQTEASLRESWAAMQQLDGYVKKNVPEERLKQYYAANKEYFDRVEVKATHIILAVSPRATPGEKAAARAKLAAIRADILAKKIDFAAAARKHSQDPTAATGGDLGFLPRKGSFMDEAFTKVAFALKPGELSDIVETEFGLHLILVAERKPGQPSQYEKCKDEVRETFADDYRAELVAKLRKEAQIKVTLP
ncbi:MAG TPA: peptidylprolyl isomerase [Urbifossiella sp.]|nr:peptidylprolyl isomerase [Urbifossiella sp.]